MNRKNQRKGAVPAAAILAAILVVAAVTRAIFLVQLGRNELGGSLSLDSQLYFDVARDIAGGGAPPAGALTFNPLYPAFLVVLFKLFGAGLLPARLVQAAIGLFTVALVYLLGRRFAPGAWKGKRHGEAVGLVAAALAVLYMPFVLYEGMLLASTLEIFLFTASFALALALDGDLRGERPVMLGSRRVPPGVSGLVLGALVGTGALGRPNLFLLLIAALPVWLFARRRSGRRWLLPAGALVAGAALFLAPPIVYNARATGRFVPVTAHGGFNFYIGNGPGASGAFQPPVDVRTGMTSIAEDSRTKAEAETGRSMTQAEVSEYYFRETIKHIARHPAKWLALIGKKLVLYFNVDVPDIPNVIFCMKTCGVLRFLFLPFSVIAPLAVCGFIVMMRGGRNRSATALFLACAVVSVVAFFVIARYRLPATPLLILLAAYFIVWSARELSLRRLKRLGAAAALAVALFFLVSGRPLAPLSDAAIHSFLGKHYAERGDEARAQEEFEQAYRLDPDKVEAIVSYARILRQRGRMQEAADAFSRAYARSPRFPLLAAEYGMALDRLGRREEAKRLYREASAADRPMERALACRLLARAAMAEGDRDEAISWVKKALVEVPGEPQLTEMLKRLESSP